MQTGIKKIEVDADHPAADAWWAAAMISGAGVDGDRRPASPCNRNTQPITDVQLRLQTLQFHVVGRCLTALISDDAADSGAELIDLGCSCWTHGQRHTQIETRLISPGLKAEMRPAPQFQGAHQWC